MHPRFILQEGFKTRDWETIRKMEYIADFTIDYNGDIYIVDAKGMATEAFKIKRKLFLHRYPDKILIVAKSVKQLKELIS